MLGVDRAIRLSVVGVAPRETKLAVVVAPDAETADALEAGGREFEAEDVLLHRRLGYPDG